MQSHARMREHMPRNKGDDDRKICQKAIGEKHLSKPSALIGKGQLGCKKRRGAAQRNGGQIAAGKLNQRAAEKVSEPHAEGRHGKTGHILISAQRNGEKAIKKPHERCSEQAA